MAKTPFRVLFDHRGYANFAGIADSLGNITKVVAMQAAREVRDTMAETIRDRSHNTEYGEALADNGITANFLHSDVGGNYDSISRSIVVHAKMASFKKKDGTKVYQYSIGAKRRGENSYVNSDTKRRSAAEVLNVVDRGVMYMPRATFKLSDGREGASKTGFWTTQGYKGKHFVLVGNSTAERKMRTIPNEFVGIASSMLNTYVKDRSTFKFDMIALAKLKAQLDKGVELE